jgi:phage shock protein E
MMRILVPLFALSAQGVLWADTMQEVLDAAPRLDAPGLGYPGQRGTISPLEVSIKAPNPVWEIPAPPINPWSESDRLPETVPPPANPAIDYSAFMQNVGQVGHLRDKRRISEEEFLRMAAEPDTIVLDARSREKYQGLHIRGAVNLPLPDITAEELEKIIRDKATRVLIYCNNNFEDLSAPRDKADPQAGATTPYGNKGFVVFRKGGDGAILLPRKNALASLNLYTFNTLYSYGYTNVYELGPLIEIQKSMLPFEGTSVIPNK